MAIFRELPADALYTRSRVEAFPFETTAELAGTIEIPGQERAGEAVDFGLGIDRPGYNIFALGPTGAGKKYFVEHSVFQRARTRPAPPDLCYVNNFTEPNKPVLLILAPGVGSSLKKEMKEFIEDVVAALPALFESEEYQGKVNAIRQGVQSGPEEGLNHLRDRAREKGIAMLNTPSGVVFAPIKDSGIVSPEDFAKLPKAEQQRIGEEIAELEKELIVVLRQVPRWEREVRTQIRDLNREMIASSVGNLLEELRQKFSEYSDVLAYLDSVQKDIAEHARDLLPDSPQVPSDPSRKATIARRYGVNVLIDHSEDTHAPVVYENHPNYDNVVGRVEHTAEMGMLLTDFNLIRPGALHRANGGYLILDARKLLLSPGSWEAIKRVLFSQEIRIESAGQALGLMSTVSLEPEPVPANFKVVLLGDRFLYYMLCRQDPDFLELFKVAADFEDVFPRNTESELAYARMMASIAEAEKLRHLDRSALARLLEHSARVAGDAERLSARVRATVDLLRESDYFAGHAGRQIVTNADVQSAIDAHIRRSDRMRAQLLEATLRRSLYIDTEGEKVGQVNGLSVIQLDGFAFGHATRITATIRLGKGEVVDIEREVELSGPLHSKGVLILAGFLGGRYAGDAPLSLSASLVFEQSYNGVDGDSASSTELYALLSAIAEVPIRQALAVTGSVNQHGAVQPIGGVNEKIEGFFDLCSARGLSGEQGVLIPASNIKNLMLRHDVVESVRSGKFHIYPVETIDEGIHLLTGLPAGEKSADGSYPEGTINHRVQRRLHGMAQKQADFAQAGWRKELRD
jgi:lon-related putative ATP-dependent protease